MKRVFAHLGFSAAVMLLILNFFSVTFAYIALGVALAALFWCFPYRDCAKG